MKKPLLLLMITCLFGCVSKNTNNDIIKIDITARHSIEQLNLKDIADVEYIKLGNDSDFIARSRPLVYSDNYILITGAKSGEILIFNRQGIPIKKFSHFGNGPHEYNYITNLCIDEKRAEIFVHDVFFQKMFVYNLSGEFIREFASGDGRFIYNFDDDSFIVYNTITNRIDPELKPYFTLISKIDGHIIKKITVPFSSDRKYDLAATKKGSGGNFTYSAVHHPIIRNSDGYTLNELSSDTIYKLSHGLKLTPFITRTPPISTMSTPVFLQCGVESSKYIFLTKVSVNENDEQNMFPETNWAYNKESGEISEYEIINDDYPDAEILSSYIVNCDIQAGYGMSRISAEGLLEAHKEGKVHGKLKDIATSIKEEDNYIIVLYKFK